MEIADRQGYEATDGKAYNLVVPGGVTVEQRVTTAHCVKNLIRRQA